MPQLLPIMNKKASNSLHGGALKPKANKPKLLLAPVTSSHPRNLPVYNPDFNDKINGYNRSAETDMNRLHHDTSQYFNQKLNFQPTNYSSAPTFLRDSDPYVSSFSSSSMIHSFPHDSQRIPNMRNNKEKSMVSSVLLNNSTSERIDEEPFNKQNTMNNETEEIEDVNDDEWDDENDKEEIEEIEEDEDEMEDDDDQEEIEDDEEEK